MTIDEGIKNLEYGTKQLEMELESGLWIKGSESELSCKEGIALNKQYIEWLTELKQWRRVYGVCPSYEMCIPECKEGYNAQITEYKRLLKAAVEDMNSNNICFDINACNVCTEKNCISCDTFHWRYTDEAEKLLNDEK